MSADRYGAGVEPAKPRHERVFLERLNLKTGERYGRVEVTGRSERQIDRIEMGMLRNLHPDWLVDLVSLPTPEAPMSETHAPGVDPAGVRHTPGPWLAASRASSVVGLPVVAQSGRSIASVTYFGLGDDFQMHNDECLANARLIAAAPDLLAAGKLCPHRADFGTASDYADAVDAWWRNEMLPALSKATGGSDE